MTPIIIVTREITVFTEIIATLETMAVHEIIIIRNQMGMIIIVASRILGAIMIPADEQSFKPPLIPIRGPAVLLPDQRDRIDHVRRSEVLVDDNLNYISIISLHYFLGLMVLFQAFLYS